ncbi:hypothetical protein [Ammoniphilus resinae]|uniref:ATP/maltotriose-dependent transcriptional regulator MalT n=1 Tax=Ammoniphilus resinae TaxID=861532 RepID=A0ABS4GX69_9BACL|nr:hypothetical protein [Ammoniphilus resinae]MBP1934841.1 ATP/maltotriose-dependent transcriptional regulator MalT [Ammoniphilus resinae]
MSSGSVIDYYLLKEKTSIKFRNMVKIPQAMNRNLVSRPELTEWLNEGLKIKLTAITAPTGFGKTTSLTVWAKESGCKVAWVALDKHDNDLVRFWSYVVAAIRGEQPNFHKNAQLTTNGEQSNIETVK